MAFVNHHEKKMSNEKNNIHGFLVDYGFWTHGM